MPRVLRRPLYVAGRLSAAARCSVAAMPTNDAPPRVRVVTFVKATPCWWFDNHEREDLPSSSEAHEGRPTRRRAPVLLYRAEGTYIHIMRPFCPTCLCLEICSMPLMSPRILRRSRLHNTGYRLTAGTDCEGSDVLYRFVTVPVVCTYGTVCEPPRCDRYLYLADLVLTLSRRR